MPIGHTDKMEVYLDGRQKTGNYLEGNEVKGEKTEWDDILVAHGVKEATYKSHPDSDELQEILQDAVALAEGDKVNRMTLKQLDEAEDEMEEDELTRLRYVPQPNDDETVFLGQDAGHSLTYYGRARL
jgi:hypothetical protein